MKTCSLGLLDLSRNCQIGIVKSGINTVKLEMCIICREGIRAEEIIMVMYIMMEGVGGRVWEFEAIMIL